MSDELQVSTNLKVVNNTYTDQYPRDTFIDYSTNPTIATDYMIISSANTYTLPITDIVKCAAFYLRNHSTNVASNCTAGLISSGNYYAMITSEMGDASIVYLNLPEGDGPIIKVESTAVFPVEIEYAIFEDEDTIIDSSSSSSES